ncbi:hypothetical protein PM082_019159 [Marasmius tenuissimus]|nr:hypothetical protein PM082_019159 [Marasmius tenuissimus]
MSASNDSHHSSLRDNRSNSVPPYEDGSPPIGTGHVLLIESPLLQQPVIMKFYDSRYIRSRFLSWTPDLESQAAEHHGGVHVYCPPEILYERPRESEHVEREEY